MDMYNIKPGSRILLLVENIRVSSIIEDWLETHQECDLRVRRAKTKGCTVIETQSIMYASNIVRWNPGVKAHIIPPKEDGKASI